MSHNDSTVAATCQTGIDTSRICALSQLWDPCRGLLGAGASQIMLDHFPFFSFFLSFTFGHASECESAVGRFFFFWGIIEFILSSKQRTCFNERAPAAALPLSFIKS